jgi:hypothetical protein
LLTLKTVPSGAVERLHACKRRSILTDFRRKVNTKFLLLSPPAALRNIRAASLAWLVGTLAVMKKRMA